MDRSGDTGPIQFHTLPSPLLALSTPSTSLFQTLGRVLLAFAVLAGVIGWEEYSIRKARSEEIAQIIADLRKWTLSHDSLTRIRLQTELEARMEHLQAPDAVVISLPPDLFDNFLGTKALSQWGEHDRPAALAWLSKQANTLDARLSILLDHWITDAPADAENYFKNLPQGQWKSRVLNGLASDAIQHGFPQRAIALVDQMPASAAAEGLLKFAAGEWARRDADSLRNWIESRPDARQRTALSIEMRRALAHRSDND